MFHLRDETSTNADGVIISNEVSLRQNIDNQSTQLQSSRSSNITDLNCQCGCEPFNDGKIKNYHLHHNNASTYVNTDRVQGYFRHLQ